jgi:hypothetical protein
MEKVNQVRISNRRVNARYDQNQQLVGFRINIPASFSAMIYPNRKYTVILELPDDEGNEKFQSEDPGIEAGE